MKSLLKATIVAALFVVASCAAGEGSPAEIDMEVTHREPRARVDEIRFPEKWLEADPARRGHILPKGESPPLDPTQLEVRRGANDELLFGALEYDSDYEFEYQPDLPRPDYSKNFFAVDLKNSFGVRTATPEEWERAARISTRPRLLVGLDDSRHMSEQGHSTRRELEYLGRKFTSTGQYWRSTTLSPSGRWLAVFSYSGRIPARSFFDFLGGGGPRRGDVFLDLYDTVNGEKVLAWQARGVGAPMWWDSTALWLGDKYFIWDGSEDSRTLVVATLPDFVPVKNPGELRFPRWLAADGSEMPAHSRYEVRRPEEPARELLFALRGEVERVVKYPTDDRPQRQAVMRRRETVYSMDFYAVSLDGEYRVRAATREEWEGARKVENTRHEFSLDETYEYNGLSRRRNRPLPRSGASPAAPPALIGGSHWVAVFSRTDAPGGAGGAAFIDVSERLTGVKMLEGRFTYTGSPTTLFAGAFWADESYLVVPTDAASRTCLLWMLPEMNRAR